MIRSFTNSIKSSKSPLAIAFVMGALPNAAYRCRSTNKFERALVYNLVSGGLISAPEVPIQIDVEIIANAEMYNKKKENSTFRIGVAVDRRLG